MGRTRFPLLAGALFCLTAPPAISRHGLRVRESPKKVYHWNAERVFNQFKGLVAIKGGGR
jgi:hypothetical protein